MNRVVIVTGASGGLGSIIAARFGANRDRVVVNYKRSLDSAEEVAKRVKEAGGEAITYQADVRHYGEVKAMVDEAVERWGRLDVMVACAGGAFKSLTGEKDKPIVDTEDEEWDLVIETNLKGAFHCVKAAAPPMMRQRDGHIIIVSSGAGLRGTEGRASYNAAKAGAIGLMKTAARELGDYNVRVNAVMPGYISHRLPPNVTVAHPGTSEHSRQSMLHRETGSSQEFADFVFNLAQMNNISGQTLNLDSRILF